MNKKFLKAIAAIAAAATLSVGVATMTACGGGDTAYDGEYHYTNYGHEYGIKVSVKLDGTKIKSVEVVDSDYVSLSDANPDFNWTEEKRQVWIDGLDGLLKAYEGQEIADVLAAIVRYNENVAAQPESIENVDEDLVLAGCTQGSGRLILAVQDALLKAAKDVGYEVKEGEAKSTGRGVSYGVKVRVIVKDGKIVKVGIIKHDGEEATATWRGNTAWFDNVEKYLEEYEGKTVEEVLAVNVAFKDDDDSNPERPQTSMPATDDAADEILGDYLVETGATESVARLLLAVQNALK